MSTNSKFLFAGPPGVGKTTAIATISEIPVIGTDAVTTDELAAVKATTTVAMDYGEITLEDGHKVRLYGTPGQERFRFMWDILAKNGLGLILLIDNSRDDPFADLALYMDGFARFIGSTDVVIGITRMTEASQYGVDDYVDWLLRHDYEVPPILEVDIRRKDDVVLLLDALLACLEFNSPLEAAV